MIRCVVCAPQMCVSKSNCLGRICKEKTKAHPINVMCVRYVLKVIKRARAKRICETKFMAIRPRYVGVKYNELFNGIVAKHIAIYCGTYTSMFCIDALDSKEVSVDINVPLNFFAGTKSCFSFSSNIFWNWIRITGIRTIRGLSFDFKHVFWQSNWHGLG